MSEGEKKCSHGLSAGSYCPGCSLEGIRDERAASAHCQRRAECDPEGECSCACDGCEYARG